jgi:XapX domain-containing protein
MAESIYGITLGLIIGGFCRYFDIPLPAPPKIVGSLLVLAMTLGFLFGQSALFLQLLGTIKTGIR